MREYKRQLKENKSICSLRQRTVTLACLRGPAVLPAIDVTCHTGDILACFAACRKTTAELFLHASSTCVVFAALATTLSSLRKVRRSPQVSTKWYYIVHFVAKSRHTCKPYRTTWSDVADVTKIPATTQCLCGFHGYIQLVNTGKLVITTRRPRKLTIVYVLRC